MFNTSGTDINATSVPFTFFDCGKDVFVGMIFSCVPKSLCFFLGVPAHLWILWLFFHDGFKIKPYHMLPLNLSLLELIYCTYCAADMLNMFLFNNNAFMTVIYFLFRLSWIGRSLMYICISIEQFLAVIYPVIFLKFRGIKYRFASAAVVWLLTAAYALYEMFQDGYRDPIFNVVFFTAVTVISFCCVSVLRSLKHPGPGNTQITTERGRDVGNQQKRNAFKTILLGLILVLVIYLPQVALSLFNVIKIDKKLLFCNIAPIMSSFNTLGVVLLPLLKIYKDGHLKPLSCQRKIKGNS